MPTALVRYGAIPEVARFTLDCDEPPERGSTVVLQTPRGRELGTLLDVLTGSRAGGDSADYVVEGPASADDLARSETLRTTCEAEFAQWAARIREWNLALELIDLERTLDERTLVLYVLNERGPDCTRLALQAAAAGLGIIEVRPVGAEGLMPVETGGGCGSGGCGSGGCSS